MRFFKAFNLLHRRTKSDIFISGSSLQSAATDSQPPSTRRYSVPVSLFDLVASQIPANFKHLDDRRSGSGTGVALPILENELNAHLIEANDRWAKEYANLQRQLQEYREELHIERRKVRCLQHKLEEDNRIILDLRMSSRRFERLLGVSNYAATDSPQDAISGETGMLLNVTVPNFSQASLANVTNIRTMDEYSSALRMTLATRKELRNQKKISLFWKRKALDSNQLQSAITPSVSTLSSIHDSLPVGRQTALDALISRRGLDFTSESQVEWKDTCSASPKILIPNLPTYQLADKIGSPIAIVSPAMPSGNSRSSHLEPLASESMKAEISSLFGSSGSVKYLAPRERNEPSHSPSLIGRFTFATSTPVKKTDLTLNVESSGDLHTIFAVREHYVNSVRHPWLTAIMQTTFGVDKLLVDESHGILNEIEDDPSISMTSVLPPPIPVPVSSGPPTRSVLQTSNIPTRRGVVTSTGTHNEVTANRLKQASEDRTSRRSKQSYKTRSAVKTVLDGHEPGPHNSPERDKENRFARDIPIFKRKTLFNSTQSRRRN
jgi:hypothetical protein